MKRGTAGHFHPSQIEVLAMKVPALLFCLLGLAACSGKPPAPQSEPTAAAASVSAPWAAMKQDEQRAKDIQKVVNKQAADQDKQVEQQTQ
jgi:ABC-type glycerol-3-phosphate transport system substrate-binding protein